MARPTKQGVDYFPFDVHLDDKFKFIEIKYKLEGFALVVKLMQRIYAQGYWCKWTDDEAVLFADETRTSFELVNNVVNECLNRGIFDSELFNQYEILTSKGIQKRYKEIVRRRKDVEVTTEYLLIDGIFGVNDDINSVNDDIKPEDGRNDYGKSTQSKLNKTKLKKTKQNDDDVEGGKLTVIQSFETSLGVILTPAQMNRLYDWLDDFNGNEDILEMAIEETALKNVGQPFSYLEGILKDWFKKKVFTVDDVLSEKKKHESRINFGSHKKQNQTRSLFEQGEESKKRQAALPEFDPERARRLKEEIENDPDLPF